MDAPANRGKTLKKRTDEFTFEVPNWAKYNPRNDYKSMPWVRLQVNLWDDPRVSRVTTTSIVLYIYLITQRAVSATEVTPCSIRTAAFKLRSKANLIRDAVDELERNQLIKIVTRSWEPRDTFATKRNGTNETNETKRSSGVLTNLHKTDKLDEPTSQTPKKSKQKTETTATWESFSNAYRKRYGSDPVRNATTNSQMANFVRRIGIEEAPAVAQFYVELTDQFYLNACHSTGILLRDSEKLRTMWANGIRNTKVDAKTAHWREQARAIDAGEL